jgi:hypothetical protein
MTHRPGRKSPCQARLGLLTLHCWQNIVGFYRKNDNHKFDNCEGIAKIKVRNVEEKGKND